MFLKAVIYTFLTHLRTQIIVRYEWRNWIISVTSPPLSIIKNSYSNFEMNTGHIDTLKHVPRSCNLDLFNAPKNAKNGPVWKIKLSTQQVTCTHAGTWLSFLQSTNMPQRNMSPPELLCTMLHTYQLHTPDNIQKLEEDTLGHVQYMASCMRTILTSLAARKDYNHEWWVENIDYEMVWLFFL